MDEERWHEHIGVYGIYFEGDALLVVNKGRGPYINRYDLPGGKLTNKESLLGCLERELEEEVGQNLEVNKQIGICNYLVPWQDGQYTHLHHVAVYYGLKSTEKIKVVERVADDTNGYELIKIHQLNKENASPLVLDALTYYVEHEVDYRLKRFDQWHVKVS